MPAFYVNNFHGIKEHVLLLYYNRYVYPCHHLSVYYVYVHVTLFKSKPIEWMESCEERVNKTMSYTVLENSPVLSASYCPLKMMLFIMRHLHCTHTCVHVHVCVTHRGVGGYVIKILPSVYLTSSIDGLQVAISFDLQVGGAYGFEVSYSDSHG